MDINPSQYKSRPVNGQSAWEQGNRKLPCGGKGMYDRMTYLEKLGAIPVFNAKSYLATFQECAISFPTHPLHRQL